MDPIQVIGLVVILTALFALGGKIVIYSKNKEMSLIKEKHNQELKVLKGEAENVRSAISEDGFKQVKRTEEHFINKLEEKETQIESLVEEIEGLKAWKEDLGLKLAKFEGATQGNQQMIIFKLLEHNQKLSKALNAKWHAIEKSLISELSSAQSKIKGLFDEAEKIHQDGIEIISEYEARLPEDFKQQVRDELLKLPENIKVNIE